MRLCFDDGGREFRIEFETAAQLGEILAALRGNQKALAPVRVPANEIQGNPTAPLPSIAPQTLPMPSRRSGRFNQERRDKVAAWMAEVDRTVTPAEVFEQFPGEFPTVDAARFFMMAWAKSPDSPIERAERGKIRHRDAKGAAAAESGPKPFPRAAASG